MLSGLLFVSVHGSSVCRTILREASDTRWQHRRCLLSELPRVDYTLLMYGQSTPHCKHSGPRLNSHHSLTSRSQPHSLTASQPCSLAALQPCSLTASAPNHLSTTPPHHHTTTPPHQHPTTPCTASILVKHQTHITTTRSQPHIHTA